MSEGSPVYGILAPSLADNPYVLAVKGTIGAYMLGTFFSLPFVSPFLPIHEILTIDAVRLYGLSLYQVYRYLRLYPKDTTYIRIIVSQAQYMLGHPRCVNTGGVGGHRHVSGLRERRMLRTDVHCSQQGFRKRPGCHCDA